MNTVSTRCAECLLTDIAREFGVSVARIKQPSNGWQDQPATRARHAAYRMLHKERRLNYSQIARMLGGRNPSTVWTGCAKAQELLDNDAEFSRLYMGAMR
jgi:chromosomal replication initiation ATPase DnaA